MTTTKESFRVNGELLLNKVKELIKEGNVRYMHQTLITADKGKCLPCSCIPTSDIILNV